MDELMTFDQVEAEVQKLSFIQRETMAEEQYAVVLQHQTYTALFPQRHKSEARSVAKQYDTWIKSQEAPGYEFLMHANCRGLVSAFEDYIIDKYAKVPKTRVRWESAFSFPEFRRAVEYFLAQKVFEVKNNRCFEGKTAFFSAAGRTSFVVQDMNKKARSYLNEAFNRGYKIKADNPDWEASQAGRIAASLTCEQMIASEDRIINRLLADPNPRTLALN